MVSPPLVELEQIISTMGTSTVPKSSLEILSQEIDDDTGSYRIRAGKRVHYVNILATVFDEDTMCRPQLLIPQLPDFPDSEWTTMDVSRKTSGSLTTELSFDALPLLKATSIWHSHTVDVLSLKQVKRHRSGVHEVLYAGIPAICKITCFGWQLHRIEHETFIYSIIEQYREPGDPIIAAKFLGHVTENGRVIGMLLEKLDGDFASKGKDDLPACREALRNFHRMNLIHGDINRYNFVIDREKAPMSVRLVDFEHAKPFCEEMARVEMESLPMELAELTGRGGTIVSAA